MLLLFPIPALQKFHTCLYSFPVNKDLFESLFDKGTSFYLGLFHFLQRIARTLCKEHCHYWEAIKNLLACVSYEEESDVQAVRQAIQNGTLSGPNKNSKTIVDEIQQSKKWKSYSRYVQTWMKIDGEMKSNLKKWFEKYPDCRDEKKGYKLYTPDTKNAYLRALERSGDITDTLLKEDLFKIVKPPAGSKSGLPIYIGNCGVESKLEKRHHLLAHYGNRSMSCQLADALNLAGIAQDNRRTHYHLEIAELDPEERLKIPNDFHNCPPFTNESQLERINKLGRLAGLNHDAHPGVCKLPKDNREQFFSEYLRAGKQRKNFGT